MSQAKTLRFKMTLTWGGVVVALLGLALLVAGNQGMGLLLTVAGMMSWLFAKRRSRATGESK